MASKPKKKDLNGPMAEAYNPQDVEAGWYEWWSSQGFFTVDPKDMEDVTDEERFVIVIPPPNVTGFLHLGHALTNSIQDSLVRWHRMKGHKTLWIPGMDHAGIATQVVVEKRLMAEEKLTRHDIGRTKFVEKVWEWKREYGNRILQQLRVMGSSVDWNREVFTMDPKLSRAVTESFITLFDRGLIYRSTRLVNWCCALKTAIADIEVDMLDVEKRCMLTVPNHERKVEVGVMHDFAYKVVDSDEELVISTTRVETMLGDTAVAVHPKDKRYIHLHGKMLQHPFVNRLLPVICDEILVDMELGTGAVKVTPAHDPNDYECGKRNNLPFINLLTDDGLINDNGGPFKGMKRYEARYHVQKKLEELGLYRGSRDNKMRLGICSRSGDIIEPISKPQWYVKCDGMAQRAIESVEKGDLQIIPASQKETWYRWLKNIRDWCISRQLWWGHRIPAYRVRIEGRSMDESDSWMVGHDENEALERAAKKFNVDATKISLEQDSDVLDTWYSSGLFPFSVFGWPDNTPELKAFYPTTLLETGFDILFFWVARMVFMGQELTGKLPFRQVFLHSMVRDKYGRKMSKCLGNVIDPLDVVSGITLQGLQEKLRQTNLPEAEFARALKGQKLDYPDGIPQCGTDALRFALCAYTTQGGDINLDILRVHGYRKFCNKIWNATKFGMKNFEAGFVPDAAFQLTGHELPHDLWMLSRLSFAIEATDKGMTEFDFGGATTAVYNFWYDMCDVYLEVIKPIMNREGEQENVALHKQIAQNILYRCLDTGLRLLHPFMPYVTEELWLRLPHRAGSVSESLCISNYPTLCPAFTNEEEEAGMKLCRDVINRCNSLRDQYNLAPRQRPTFFVEARNASVHTILSAHAEDIKTLAGAEAIHLLLNEEPPGGCATEVVNDSCSAFLMLKGMIDPKVEMAKLAKKKQDKEKLYNNLYQKTQLPTYETKVPVNVRQLNSQKLEAYKQEMEAIHKVMENFRSLLSE